VVTITLAVLFPLAITLRFTLDVVLNLVFVLKFDITVRCVDIVGKAESVGN
jgi:hypothetical protein